MSTQETPQPLTLAEANARQNELLAHLNDLQQAAPNNFVLAQAVAQLEVGAVLLAQAAAAQPASAGAG